MNLLSKAKLGAKWNAISMLGSAALSILQISILARYLQPLDFGIFALLIAILSILSIFITVSISDVIIVKDNATYEQLSTLYWLNAMLGIFIYILIFFSAPLLIYFNDYDQIILLLRVIGLSVIIGALGVQFRALMKRNLYLKELAFIDLFAHFCAFMLLVFLVLKDFGVWSLVFSTLLSQSITLFIFIIYATFFGWLPKFYFNIKTVIEMIHFGSHRIGSSLLHALFSRADQLTIGVVLGPIALGYYSIAFNLAMQPFLKINPVLTQVSFPIFSRIKNDNTMLKRGYRKGVRVLTFINAPLLLGMLSIAPLFIPFFLGPGWDNSIIVLQFLCIYVLFRSITNINTGLILAKEKFRWPTYWSLFLVFLIPFTIIITAQVTNSLYFITFIVMMVEIILFIVAYFLFPRRLLGNFDYKYLSDIGRPILSASIMSLFVYILSKNMLINSQIIELTILILFGMFVYIILSFIIQRRHLDEFLEVTKSEL